MSEKQKEDWNPPDKQAVAKPVIMFRSLVAQSVSTFRGNFAQLFLIAFLGHLVLYVSNFILGDPFEALGLSESGGNEFSFNDGVTIVVDIVVADLTHAAMVFGTMQYLSGRQATAKQCLNAGITVLLPLIVVTTLTLLATFLGLIFLFVPGLILTTIWIVTTPVVVVERIGIVASLRRSQFLTKGSRWRIFWAVSLFFIVFVLFTTGSTFLVRDMISRSSIITSMLFYNFLYSIITCGYFAFVCTLYRTLTIAKENKGTIEGA